MPPEVLEDEPEVESRRDLLSAAWDEAIAEETPKEVKADGTEQPTTEPVSGVEDPPVPEGEPKPDAAKGKTDPKVAKPKPGEKPKGVDPLTQERKAAAADGKTEPVTDKAPNSWKVGAKAHWAKLPAEVRADVTRREYEIQKELSQTAQIRKFSSDLANVVAPHMHLIRAQNSTPLAAIKNLLTTAAGLSQGSSSQKAQIVAEIIGAYAVDVKELDGMLSKNMKDGNFVPPQPQVQAPPAWAAPIFNFMQEVQGSKTAYQQRMAQDAEQEITKFEGKPFFDDLRDEMADLMEVAANRGITMSLDDAYNRAVALHPEVSKILAQRTAASGVSAAAATLARSKKAASTVVGAPAASALNKKAGAGAGTSRRDLLSAAWDDASS